MTTIRTSHAGSLPRTGALIAANRARRDEDTGAEAFDELLTENVVDVVARQRALGITEPNDGEYGHAMAADFDYGAWWHYSFARTGGLSLSEHGLWEQPAVRSEPGQVRLTSFGDRRDRQLFPGVYADPAGGADTGEQPDFPKVTGPISYTCLLYTSDAADDTASV